LDFSLYHNGEAIKSIKKKGIQYIVPSPRKEIPIGTFRSIIRQAGLSVDDFFDKNK